MAIRAVAHGMEAAFLADCFIHRDKVTGMPGMFNSRIGKLLEGEIDEFMTDADPSGRVKPEGGNGVGFGEEGAARESARCLHCECLKRNVCRLRGYSIEQGASPGKYRSGGRKRVEKIGRESGVMYEPGKCVKCGLCVRITEKVSDVLGLTFIGRGFDVRVGVPFDESLAEALGQTAAQCVEACPTSALAHVGTGAAPKAPREERRGHTAILKKREADRLLGELDE
jgi:ferredoxin